MTSADFSRFSHTSLYGLSLQNSFPQRILETSPGKNDNFHPVYLPDLLYGVRVVLDFVLYCKLVRPKPASYLVRIPQTGILLTASFRFHLTMDTLAVQLVVPTTKPTADFHRLATAHAGRTIAKALLAVANNAFSFY